MVSPKGLRVFSRQRLGSCLILRFKDFKCFKWKFFQPVNVLKSITPIQVSRVIFSFVSSLTFFWVKMSALEIFFGNLPSIVLSFSPLKCFWGFFFFNSCFSPETLALRVRVHPPFGGRRFSFNVRMECGGRGGERSRRCDAPLQLAHLNYSQLW